MSIQSKKKGCNVERFFYCFSFLLVSSLAFFLFILPVSYGINANSTICGYVNESITLAVNIQTTDTCYTINVSNVVINGNGFIITGNSSGFGVNATGFQNITVKGFSGINNFTGGVRLTNAENSTIVFNNITTANDSLRNMFGIWATAGSRNLNITQNSIIVKLGSSGYGMLLTQANNSVVARNNVTVLDGTQGIYLDSTPYTNVTYNLIFVNGTATAIAMVSQGISPIINASNNQILFNNITAGGSGAAISVGSDAENISGNIIKLIGDAGQGIYVSSSKGTVVSANDINATGPNGFSLYVLSSDQLNISLNTVVTSGASAKAVYVSSSGNTIYSTNIVKTLGTTNALSFGIYLDGTSENNTFMNNNVTAVGTDEIRDEATNPSLNYLLYNNSFGEIRWTAKGAGQFLDNLTLNGTLSFPGSIFIGNNTASINLSEFTIGRINSTANITLRSIGFNRIDEILRLETFNTTYSELVSGGKNCNGTSCLILNYNTTTGDLLFNTSGFSSFAGDQVCSRTLNFNYTLQVNVISLGTCFTINASNIVLDGGGYKIQGDSSGFGIDNTAGFDNVTIIGFRDIENFTNGIKFSGSENSSILNNNITGANVTNGYGIYFLASSHYANITGNKLVTVGVGSQGVRFESSNNSVIAKNNITTKDGGTAAGLYLYYSQNTNATGNLILTNGSNSYGILFDNAVTDYLAYNNITTLAIGSQGFALGTAVYGITVLGNNVTTSGGAAAGFSGSFSIGRHVIQNNFFSTGSSTAITLSDQNGTNVINNIILTTGSDAKGISLTDISNSNITSNKIITTGLNGFAIQLNGATGNNTFMNNNISASNGIEIDDQSGTGTLNYMIYNDTFGEIRWTNTSASGFLDNISLDAPIGLGVNLFIDRNVIAVNVSAFTSALPHINSTANITMRNVTDLLVDELLRLDTYNTSRGNILAGGKNCNGTSCTFFSYNATSNVLLFNTSQLSSFTSYVIDCGNVFRNITLVRSVASNGTCFTVLANNIVLTGNAFNVTGNTSGFGIDGTAGFDNITIRGFGEIFNFTVGVELLGSENSTVVFNNITSANVTNGYGIYFLTLSHYGNISRNRIITNGVSGQGIRIETSNGTTLFQNNITTFGTSTAAGLTFVYSESANASGNRIWTNGSSSFGMTADAGALLSITYNNITTFGVSSDAVSLSTQSRSSTFIGNNITTFGTTARGFFASDAGFHILQNNFFSVNGSLGISLLSSNASNFSNNVIIADRGGGAVLLTDTSDTTFLNNTLRTTGTNTVGIKLSGATVNNTFLNNNISATNAIEIIDQSVSPSLNYLIYNNTFGEIRWIDSSSTGFLENITVDAPIGLDVNLFIGNGTFALNTTAFQNSSINSSANITFRNTGLANVDQIVRLSTFNMTKSEVLQGGTDCKSTTCFVVNVSSGGLFVINTTVLGSIALLEARCQDLFRTITLQRNITTAGSCFFINATNVLIDGNGFSITGNKSGYGIYGAGFGTGIGNMSVVNFAGIFNFSTSVSLQTANIALVKNNTIISANVSSGYGLEFASIGNVSVLFNIIKTVGDNAAGIRLNGLTSSNITGNNVTTNGSSANGVQSSNSFFNVYEKNFFNTTNSLSSALSIDKNANATNNILFTTQENSPVLSIDSNSLATFNTITGFENGSYGILLGSSAENITLENNTVTTTGKVNGLGIRLPTGNNFVKIINNTILTTGTSSGDEGIEVFTSNGTLVKNNRINTTSLAGYGVYIADSNHVFVDTNQIITTGSLSYGIFLQTNSTNVTFYNNNISTVTTLSLFDNTFAAGVNYLIYNNSFGEIRWTDNSTNGFLRNMNITGSIDFGNNLILSANLAAVNISAFLNSKINSSANITLRSLTLTNIDRILRLDTFNTSRNDVLVGTNCNGTSCTLISYNATTGLFLMNVSYLGSFTAYEASCGTLFSSLTLSKNISATGSCFVVGGNNIVLDGNGFIVTGNGTGFGVNISSFNNATIKNFGALQNFSTIILLATAENNTITNNTIVGMNQSSGHGVSILRRSMGTNILNNQITISGQSSNSIESVFSGSVCSCNFSVIQNNIITVIGASSSAINMARSSSNNITNNTITLLGNIPTGLQFTIDSNNNIILKNTILVNQSNGATGISFSQVLSNNVTGNNITSLGTGISFQNSRFFSIVGNSISSSNYALYIVQSNNSNISSNIFIENGSFSSVELSNATGNLLENNVISALGNGSNYGIFLYGTTENTTFINNNISSVQGTSIEDRTQASLLNYIIYNNSFGEIRWTDTSTNGFLDNITLTNPIGLGINLFIGNGTASLNTTAFSASKINSSANITLRNLTFSKVDQILKLTTFNTSRAQILPAGTNCNGTTCSIVTYNVTTGDLLFNTTTFGSFAAFIAGCGVQVRGFSLTGNLNPTGSCFSFSSSNIVIDGNGNNVTGNSSGIAFNIENASNVTVKNFGIIGNFTQAIALSNAENGTVTNLTVTGSNVTNEVGVLFIGSTGLTIQSATVSVTGINSSGVSLSGGNSSTISGVTLTTSGENGSALLLTSGKNVSITNVLTNATATGSSGITLANVIGSSIFGGTLASSNGASSVALGVNSANNTFTNVTFIGSSSEILKDSSGAGSFNYLIFDNAFGTIQWTSSSFLDNLSLSAPLGFGINLVLTQNLAGINLSAFNLGTTRINSSANITLKSLTAQTVDSVIKSERFVTTVTDTVQLGVNCNGTSCLILSYNATNGLFKFNTSSFSSFTTYRVDCGELFFNLTLFRNVSSNSTCFIINASNILVDGNGYAILGTGSGFGINATDRTSVVLKNLFVSNFTTGILFSNASNGTLTNSTIVGTNGANVFGVRLTGSSQEFIKNITVRYVESSIFSFGDLFDKIDSVTVSNATTGILLQDTNSTNVTNIYAVNNSYGVRIVNASVNSILGGNISYSKVNGVSLEGTENNNTVAHATIYKSSAQGIIASVSTVTDSLIQNNTLFENTLFGISMGGTGTVLQNNVFNHTVGSLNATAQITSSGNRFLSGGRGIVSTNGIVTSLNDYLFQQGTVLLQTLPGGQINLTNVTVANNSGEINFYHAELGTSRTIQNDILIFNRTIFVNASSAPEFNVSALISFFNVGLPNPLLLKDGVKCLLPECNVLASVPTFKANVTGFSNYTLIDILDFLDSVKPSSGRVFDGPDYIDSDYTNNVTTLYGSWSGFIDANKISYKYRILENGLLFYPSSGYVVLNDSTQTTVGGLSLNSCGNYSFVVIPTDSFSNEGPNVTSNGIFVDTTAPGAPTVTSSTHPTEGTNYTLTNVSLSWTVPTDGGACPSGVSGFSFLLDQDSAGVPDTIAEGNQTLTSTSYAGLGTGTYYFHIRAKDLANNFGSTATFSIQIISSDVTVILNPVQTPTILASVNLTGTVSKNTTGVRLFVNDVLTNTTTNNATLQYTFSNVALSVGINKIYAQANMSNVFVNSNNLYVRRLSSTKYNVTSLTIKCTGCAGGTKYVSGGGTSAPLFGAATEGSATIVSGQITVTPGKNNFIFVTKANGAATVAARESYLINETFSDQDNPSFGQSLLLPDQKVGLVIEYPDITLSGTDQRQTGRYSVIIKNNGIGVDGKLNLSINLQ